MKSLKKIFRKQIPVSKIDFFRKLWTTNSLSYSYFWVLFAWSECWNRPVSQQVRVFLNLGLPKKLINLISFHLLNTPRWSNKAIKKWHNFLKRHKFRKNLLTEKRERSPIRVNLIFQKETYPNAGFMRTWSKNLRIWRHNLSRPAFEIKQSGNWSCKIDLE